MAVPVCQIGILREDLVIVAMEDGHGQVCYVQARTDAVVRENVSGDSNVRFAIRSRGGAYVARFASLERQAGQTHLTGGSRWGFEPVFG
jgi:hypothetical protein